MTFLKKWYTYQKERFPLLTYGLYCFCIVFGTFCFCSYYAKTNYEIAVFNSNFGITANNYYLLIPMFIVGFLQFLMVRILDEFKDYEEDCKFRPYRPVPRGLVSLKELRNLFIICAVLQITITVLINPGSLLFLGFVWAFLAIMTSGFFIKDFLDKHILCEVFLDELLLPITVMYISSFIIKIDCTCLWKLEIMTYIISWIIEVARKIRCKEAEEKGVKTYTAVFGILKATMLLWALEIILLIIVHFIISIKSFTVIALVIISIFNVLFIIKKNKVLSKCVEYSADIYVMMMLISLVYLIY